MKIIFYNRNFYVLHRDFVVRVLQNLMANHHLDLVKLLRNSKLNLLIVLYSKSIKHRSFVV